MSTYIDQAEKGGYIYKWLCMEKRDVVMIGKLEIRYKRQGIEISVYGDHKENGGYRDR